MVQTFAATLMSAEADALCDAPYGQRSAERTNRRNGYRLRRWDTRVGSIDLRIPKLREGSYFPDWLLDARTRAERAFIQVVAEAYVKGVSIRRVAGLVETLGIASLSKSQVSEMAAAGLLDLAAQGFLPQHAIEADADLSHVGLRLGECHRLTSAPQSLICSSAATHWI